MNKIEISVVICTYNRVLLLRECLLSLIHQTVKRSCFEIVVVDNNSSDKIKDVTLKLAKNFKNIRYFFERKEGTSYARNLGYKVAKGNYVAYIDDDSLAESDWIKNILEFINKKPKAVAFGGPYRQYSKVTIPAWFPPEFGENNYSNREKQIEFGKEWLSGTNMIFKRDLLIKFCGFNTKLGVFGKNIAYGEETELQTRLAKAGEKVYYVPNIKVKHLLDKKKMSLAWLIQDRYQLGKNIVASHGRRDSLLYHFASFGHKFILMIYYLLLPKNIPIKRRLYYAFAGLASACGAFENYLKKTFPN